MTAEQVKALREIYDNKQRGYNLYINSTNDMFPSKSQESILAYDDKKELVHCLRRSLDPYAPIGTAAIATTSYEQIIKFDMNISPQDLKGVLDDLVAKGLVTKDVAESFITRMNTGWKNPQRVSVDVSNNQGQK